jgi:hypothetical protein
LRAFEQVGPQEGMIGALIQLVGSEATDMYAQHPIFDRRDHSLIVPTIYLAIAQLVKPAPST